MFRFFSNAQAIESLCSDIILNLDDIKEHCTTNFTRRIFTNLSSLQSFSSTVYNVFFKRNSIFVGTVFASAFVFQAAFDSAVTSWYENHNKGKLWKDVKVQLLEGGDEEDDE